MAVSKDRLREILEAAMEDVAMAMSEGTRSQHRLLEVRQACATVWQMADLGDVPEYETQVRAVKVS